HRRGGGPAAAFYLRAAAPATVRQRSRPALGLAVALHGRTGVFPGRGGGEAGHSLLGLVAQGRHRSGSWRVTTGPVLTACGRAPEKGLPWLNAGGSNPSTYPTRTAAAYLSRASAARAAASSFFFAASIVG